MANRPTNEIVTRGPTKQMWRRTLVAAGLLIIAFAFIVGNLAYTMLGRSEYWQKRAISQQLSDSLISANRGTIYDADMNVLAQSYGVYTVIMSPRNIRQETTRQKIADELSVMLDVDRDKLYENTQKSQSAYVVVKSKIELSLAQELSDWVQKHELAGVLRIIQDYKRIYPMNNLLSATIGFTGTDGYGLYGLEAEYEEVLAGTPGRIMTATDGVGNDLPTSLKFEKTVDAENGGSIVLTVNSTVQAIAEKHLEQAVIEKQCNNRGLIIVMEVDTGAILASAVKGDFDLNEPMTVADPNIESLIAELSGDEQSAALKEAREKQWSNKVVSDFYEPGSVFKVFTASMAVEEGIVSPSSHMFCSGSLHVADRNPKCWVYPRSHGSQTFAQALSNSCNPAFMNTGLSIGAELFSKYFQSFGFTEITGVDMLSESRVTESLYHTVDELGPVEIASSSIGQTFKVTPIQMITAMCAVANGGYLMQPYIVQQILDEDGNVKETIAPQVKRQVISKETSATVASMMAKAVDGGGARNAYVAGYRVAGKTGTSEKTETRGDEYIEVWGSFSGFAPADDPQIAVLVVMDEPQSLSRYGGTVAAPVAQKVLSEVLPYLGVDPEYTIEELKSLSTATPNVVDKELSQAQTTLKNLGLDTYVIGTGSTVVRQMPEAGASVPKGGTVVLYTSEADHKKAIVPNFNGMTLSQANLAAANANINLLVSGLNSEAGDAKADTQSIAAGTEVAQGTVVTVQFIYEDTIA